MRFHYFIFLLALSATNAFANTTPAATLNFSDDLLQAVEQCQPHRENLTHLNPNFGAYFSPDLAQVDIQQIFSVEGKNDTGNCTMTFRQKIKDMGESLAECNLTDEQREALLIAMKDHSEHEYSDTFQIQKGVKDKDGNPIQLTISGSLFHVVYNKIINTSCYYLPPQENYIYTEEIPTEVEGNVSVSAKKDAETALQEEPFIQYDVFEHSFMESWQICRPDVTERTKDQTTQKIEIIGMQDKKCLVRFEGFDLDIPPEILPNIHSFDDVTQLLKNKDLAHYTYKPEYNYKGLIYALDACFKKTDYYGVTDTTQKENMAFHKGLSAEYRNQQCVIRLQNELDINGSITDYSVYCYLDDKILLELQPYFKEMLDQYGQKRMFAPDGHVTVRKAEFNEDTHKGDLALMFYLQQHNYCKHSQ